ncbi:MAG: hypothetical protein FJZ97_02785 [Chloroflexi bacterium]|nr:hypothetical protein [Chloroflexota bacterium]
MEASLKRAANPRNTTSEKGPGDVVAYLASLQPEPRRRLEKLRGAILAAAPGAVEGFSYGVPAIRVGGKPVVCYAAAKTHYSLFPMSGAVMGAFAADLKAFHTSKGTIRFSMDKALPVLLVRRIVKARLAELRGK